MNTTGYVSVNDEWVNSFYKSNPSLKNNNKKSNSFNYILGFSLFLIISTLVVTPIILYDWWICFLFLGICLFFSILNYSENDDVVLILTGLLLLVGGIIDMYIISQKKSPIPQIESIEWPYEKAIIAQKNWENEMGKISMVGGICSCIGFLLFVGGICSVNSETNNGEEIGYKGWVTSRDGPYPGESKIIIQNNFIQNNPLDFVLTCKYCGTLNRKQSNCVSCGGPLH